MSDEGRLVAGRYSIIRRIGTGAMGAVWQAHDEVLHRTVAIKQLLLQPGLDEHEAEDARQRTMREGRIAARLHHPNAISVFDVVTDENGQPCLIMEYLDSTSLAAVLQERGTLPPREVARIGAQVAAALKEAHAVGIVHRDIKPGNILLSGNGLVKITDFGISRAKDDVTVTKTGMIAGTPAYLAPEVAIGGDPGPESDVFSLGSTLYAACEGQPPFGLSENTLGLLHAVAAGQINPPRQSGPLASVLAVLLHPEVEHRPTAAECEELLAAVARGETPLGGPADATRVAPAAGAAALGAGAAGAAGAADEDEVLPAGYSGTLAGAEQDLHGGDAEEDRFVPASGYPDEDYDYQGQPADAQATRALAADQAGLTRFDEGSYDDPDYVGPEDEPAEEKRHWKVPALVGAVVLAGMVAMGIWVFGDSGRGTQQVPDAEPPQVVTSTSTTELTTTEPEITEPVDEEPMEPPVQQPQPQPTQQPQPRPQPQPTKPTTTKTTTPSRSSSTTTPPPTSDTTVPSTDS
ncbi:Serine/threonine protein kinase [Amycolatopsis arida]|uniref:non-specific serine/threonine protein kinase n=1 Tax=Amycolatopsis arida TaxID=587909 RepID=A0A1I5WXH3_9PSEU|nr:serine/threonine-protein kinase [Amycolatopsis arida]TDX92502.1 serine/threonine protein kinase [Amycolatopsis arida]SFQ24442.1 Serine/threonine protein kinase [Amycolatopsis arida]